MKLFCPDLSGLVKLSVDLKTDVECSSADLMIFLLVHLISLLRGSFGSAGVSTGSLGPFNFARANETVASLTTEIQEITLQSFNSYFKKEN